MKAAGARLFAVVAAMTAAGCTVLLGSFDKIDGDGQMDADDAIDSVSADSAAGTDVDTASGDSAGGPDSSRDASDDTSRDASDDTTSGDTTPASDSDAAVDSTADDGAGDVSCDASTVVCGGRCSDLTTDSANCGACGYACVGGRTCVSGRCSPAWIAMATTGQPSARTYETAAFAGGKFVVVGGTIDGTNATASGGSYDVSKNTWSTADLVAARCQANATASPTHAYVFGGLTNCHTASAIGALEEFDPTSNSWKSITAAGEPSPRSLFVMGWTGSALFLYGGGNGAVDVTTSGARYTPGVGWSAAPCALTGCGRYGPGAVFADGTVVHVWSHAASGDSGDDLDWSATTGWAKGTLPAGVAQVPGSVADDGRRLFWLSGTSGCTASTVKVVTYDRKTGLRPDDTSVSPIGFATSTPSIAWSGAELLVWSSCGPGGARFQPVAPGP